MLFSGAATAVITPFNEKGIDYSRFEKQLDYQLKSGIKALIVCGTTGEASTMSDSERFDAVSFAVKHTNKRIPIVAGTGSNDTSHSMKLTKDAYNAGADAVLATAPYYNRSSQNGLLAHFGAICKSSPLPLILYNIPSRVGMNLDPKTIHKLASNLNIIGIKECSLSQMDAVIHNAPGGFTVYSGDDSINLQALALGAKGVISVLSNIMPYHVAQLNDVFLRDNNIDLSRELFYKTKDLIHALFIETNPIPIKKAMQLASMDSGDLRLPLVEMAEEYVPLLENELKELGVI